MRNYSSDGSIAEEGVMKTLLRRSNGVIFDGKDAPVRPRNSVCIAGMKRLKKE